MLTDGLPMALFHADHMPVCLRNFHSSMSTSPWSAPGLSAEGLL